MSDDPLDDLFRTGVYQPTSAQDPLFDDMGLDDPIESSMRAEARRQTIDAEDQASGSGSVWRQIAAGGRNWMAGTANLAAEVTGNRTAKEYAEEQRMRQEALLSRSGFVQKWDDVEDPLDALSLAAGTALSSTTDIATLAAGGLVGGALKLGRAGTAAAMVAPNVPSRTGAQLETQREQSGDVNWAAAVPLGVADASLDLLGFEGLAVRGLPTAAKALTTRSRRAAAGAALGAAGEATAETLQQFTSELARRSVDDEFDVFGAESQKRYKEAAIVGGLTGGLVTGAQGAASRQAERPSPRPSVDPQEAEAPLVTPDQGVAEPAKVERGQPSLDAMGQPVDNTGLFTTTESGEVTLAKGPTSIIAAIRGDSPLTKPIRDMSRSVQDAVAKGDTAPARAMLAQYEDQLMREGMLKPGELDTFPPALVRAQSVLDEFDAAKSQQAMAQVPPTGGQLGVFSMTAEGPRITNPQLLRNYLGANASTGKFSDNRIARLANQITEAVRLQPDFPESVPELSERIDLALQNTSMRRRQREAFTNALNVLNEYMQLSQNAPPAAPPIPTAVQRMAGPGVPITAEAANVGQSVVQKLGAQQQAVQAQAAQAQAEQAAVQQEQEQAALEQQDAIGQQLDKDLQGIETPPAPIDPAQLSMTRDAIMAEVQSNPALDGKRLPAFIQRLRQAKVFGPDPLPTPKELTRLAKTVRSIGKAEGVTAPVSTLPDGFEPTNPGAQNFEEPARPAPGTENEQQRRALERVGRIKALKPRNDSAALQSMLKDVTTRFEALAGTLSDSFLPELDKLIDNIGSVAKLDVGRQLAQMKQVRDALTRIEQQVAQPQGQLPLSNIGQDARAAIRNRAPRDSAPAAPAPTPAAFTTEVQPDLFDAKGQPSKAAKGETNEQVRTRIQELAEKNSGGNAAMLQKQLQLRRLESAVGKPGLSNTDIQRVISSVIDPSTTPADAKALVDTAVELSAMANPAPPTSATPESNETSEPVESESAVLDEENPGVNPPPGTAYSRPARDRAVPMTNSVDYWRREVETLTLNWRDKPPIVVVSPSQPGLARTPMEKAALRGLIADGGRAFGFYQGAPGYRGYIAINADMTTRGSLTPTVLHEALGHYGLRNAFGSQWVKVLRELLENPDFANAVQEEAAVRPLGDATPAQFAELYYAEEVLARMAENQDLFPGRLSWLDRFRAMLESFARRLGWRKTWSNQDIGDMIVFAREASVYGSRRAMGGAGAANTALTRAAQAAGVPMALPPMPRRADNSTVTQEQQRQSQSRAIRAAFERNGLPEWAARTAITANDLRLRAFMGTMFGRDLVDYAKSYNIPSYERYFNTMQEVQAVARNYIEQLNQIMVDSGRLPADQRTALNTFLKAHTMGKKWGYQPQWAEAPQVVIDPKAKAQWDEFRTANPEAALVADRVFSYGYKSRLDLRAAVKAHIEKEAAGDLNDSLTDAEIRKIEQRKQRQINIFNKSVPMIEGPYAPLSRFGEFAAIAKSKAFREAELKVATNPADTDARDALEQLKVNPDHYAVHFTDSLGQAEMLAAELDRLPAFAGTKAEAFERTTAFEQIGDPPLLQMQKLKDMVHNEIGTRDKFDRDTAQAITQMVRDLYVRSLAETSARKHDVYRKGIAGASEDMMRAFAQKGRADANFLGQIKNQYEMGEILQTIMREGNIKDPLLADRKRIVGEITRRHVAGMKPDDTPWQDKAMAISSFWHLATSPRYYIMNALQTWMFAAPVLAGRYGAGAYSSLATTYYELMPVFTAKEFWAGKVDVTQATQDPTERAALKRMQDLGLLEAGMQYDAGYWEATGDGSIALARANHAFRTVSGQIEFVNRVTAGLAAHRLEMKRSGNADAAQKRMQDIIAQTQFDYSRSNAPSFFNALPKVMTQFKKYQLGQIALQGRLLYNAAVAAKPEERATARKAIGYMYTQLALVTGLAGIPAMQLIGVIADAIFGDEDRPLDGEQFLEELVGKTAYRGVPTAAGFEMSGLGLGALLNPFPFVDYKELTTREGLQENVLSFIGPIAGVAEKQVRAYEAAQQGEWLRAAGEALPSGFTGAVRGFELATRGLEKKNGDMLLEPDTLKGLVRAVGFTPTEIRDAQLMNARKFAHEEYFKGRQSSLVRAYNQAAKAKDTSAQTAIVAQWKNLQEAKDRAGFTRTPLTNLLRAPRAQQKREAETVGGVQTTTSNREFVRRALD